VDRGGPCIVVLNVEEEEEVGGRADDRADRETSLVDDVMCVPMA
jgi:hypothetical protein